MSTVCVIGAGIAGLSGATRLKRAGYDVTVYEAQPSVGGRAANCEREGMRFTSGANIFYGFSPAMRALLADNGLSHIARRLPRLQARCIGESGQWSVDMTPTPQFLTSRDFSIADKLRLARFMAGIVLGARGADGDDACSTLAHDGETLRAFCEPRMGRVLTEKMVGIVYRSARGMGLDDISPSTFISMMRALAFDRSVMAIDGGIGAIAAKLGEDVGVATGVKVRDVAEREDGCTVTLESGEQRRFDLAIVAVEGNQARNLVSTAGAKERAFLGKVTYNATIYCHCLLAGAHPGGQWFLSGPRFPWISAAKISAVTDEGQPAIHVTLTVAPEIVQRSGVDIAEDEVLDRCLTDMRGLFPTLHAAPKRWFVQKVASKTPLFVPGYGVEAAQFRALQEAPERRVFYAGDYLYQPLLGGAALSGARIADHIARHWPDLG